MNKVILLALLIPVTVSGQVMEDFEAGRLSDWIQYPGGHWETDQVNAVSGSRSLHHSFDNSEAGLDVIGKEIRNLHPEAAVTEWKFTVRHGYDPSASNNWAVILMSDSDPGNSINGPGMHGFAVGVNQDGYDDSLRLWKIKGGEFKTVVNSQLNWQTCIEPSDAATISVKRTPAGEWSVEVAGTDNIMIASNAGYDKELFSTGWFLISYRYTSTRDRLLWVDDIIIKGDFHEDRDPPHVTECKAVSDNLLLVSFDEPVSEESLPASNFLLGRSGRTAERVITNNLFSVYLEFREQFVNKTAENLVLGILCDRFSNCLMDVEIEFTFIRADPGDVIISEIMADPVPAAGLPPEEYLELYNRSLFTFNLKNWTLSDGNNRYLLNETAILPGEHIIICQAGNMEFFRGFGKVSGLKNFPALTDGGKLLYLCDSTSTMIHGLEYSSGWYGDLLKAGGGWSLEMIDTDYPFSGSENWRASVSREGGSPGRINSVSAYNPDRLFSGIENVFPSDSCTVGIKFSETVTGIRRNTIKIRQDGYDVDTIFHSDPLFRNFTACLGTALQPGRIYTLSVGDEVTDFEGNRMDRNEFSFGIPEPVREHDILFNELLFNPFPDEPDYIELINCSDRIINISDLFLLSVDDIKRDTSSLSVITSENHCLIPCNYIVITSDKDALEKRFYIPDKLSVLEVSSLPSMPDDEGHLILYNRYLDKIDEVYYDEEMHYSLLDDNEGISLEKISTNSNSSDRSQWHSASELSGWGTPGAPNSVLYEFNESGDNLAMSSSSITPDNDGNEDFLVIDFKMKGPGSIISVDIFDESGRFIKRLTNNLFSAQEASIVWNGTGVDEELLNTGIYILLITAFNEKGESEKWKRVCTVIRN
jgi:hypothetical protein